MLIISKNILTKCNYYIRIELQFKSLIFYSKDFNISKYKIKLNKNENSYPISKNIVRSIGKYDLNDLRYYPEKNSEELCSVAASIFGVDSNFVIATNGTNEAFSYIFTTLIKKRDSIVIPSPTHRLHMNIIKRFKSKCSILEHNADFSVNMGKVLNEENTVFILTNPSSTTALSIDIKSIESFLSTFKGTLIIDETYTMFSGDTSLKLIEKYSNLIITRSLSISHSLPGIRLSFILTSNIKFIDKINDIKDKYNISTLTCLMGIEALKDAKNTLSNILSVIKQRDKLSDELNKLGFLVMPSKTNFLLAKSIILNNHDIYGYLESESILVRYFEDEKLGDWIRIAVGSEKENIILIQKIKALIKNNY